MLIRQRGTSPYTYSIRHKQTFTTYLYPRSHITDTQPSRSTIPASVPLCVPHTYKMLIHTPRKPTEKLPIIMWCVAQITVIKPPKKQNASVYWPHTIFASHAPNTRFNEFIDGMEWNINGEGLVLVVGRQPLALLAITSYSHHTHIITTIVFYIFFISKSPNAIGGYYDGRKYR